MTLRVLVPIAQKPGRHEAFRAAVERFARELPAHNPKLEFDFAYCRKEFDGAHADRIPAARNWLLDTRLDDDHDLVFWFDDDIVEMPYDLPTRLWRANPRGVTAPLVLIEGHDTFYDTRGFIEDGCFVRALPPYFRATGELVDLDSVGACYLAPAELYRAGVRYPRSEYDHGPDGVTEHAFVCADARRAGMRVACLTTVAVRHADLPRYGEQYR